MNNFKIEIYKNKIWVDYTSKCVFPLKIADFLDEQLDEVNLFIKNTSTEYFEPQTIFAITLVNYPECVLSDSDIENIKARSQNSDIEYTTIETGNADGKRLKETITKYFILATDNSVEKPIGSGKFEHQIYLIELTKILEGFIGDSITFTNTLGNNYTGD